MSGKFLFGLVSFVLGGIIGGGAVGYIVGDGAKKEIEKLEKDNDRLYEEVKALRAMHDEKNVKNEEEENEENEDEDTDMEEIEDQYNELRRKYVSSNADEDDIYSDDGIIDNDHASKIKRISEETFNNDLNYRDIEQLIYYQEDGTLVDSARDIISNEADVVGYEVMDIIEETDDDYLYALDDDDNKMYEITVEHDLSYMRDVLGIGG